MNGMIERVARAIALSNRAPDSDDWPVYVNDAKAAIEAMRDATPDMIAAMAKDIGPLRLMWIAAIDAALSEDNT